ncbi:hypothetical protein E4T56_gene7459, partial [Termitomyces sp. T112]
TIGMQKYYYACFRGLSSEALDHQGSWVEFGIAADWAVPDSGRYVEPRKLVKIFFDLAFHTTVTERPLLSEPVVPAHLLHEHIGGGGLGAGRILLHHRRVDRHQHRGIGRRIEPGLKLHRPAVIDAEAQREHQRRDHARRDHQHIAALVAQQAREATGTGEKAYHPLASTERNGIGQTRAHVALVIDRHGRLGPEAKRGRVRIGNLAQDQIGPGDRHAGGDRHRCPGTQRGQRGGPARTIGGTPYHRGRSRGGHQQFTYPDRGIGRVIGLQDLGRGGHDRGQIGGRHRGIARRQIGQRAGRDRHLAAARNLVIEHEGRNIDQDQDRRGKGEFDKSRPALAVQQAFQQMSEPAGHQ